MSAEHPERYEEPLEPEDIPPEPLATAEELTPLNSSADILWRHAYELHYYDVASEQLTCDDTHHLFFDEEDDSAVFSKKDPGVAHGIESDMLRITLPNQDGQREVGHYMEFAGEQTMDGPVAASSFYRMYPLSAEDGAVLHGGAGVYVFDDELEVIDGTEEGLAEEQLEDKAYFDFRADAGPLGPKENCGPLSRSEARVLRSMLNPMIDWPVRD